MRKSKTKTKRTSKSKELAQIKEDLETERQKSSDYLNRLKYLQADYENYRKRVERESLDTALRANEKLVANLLSVIDDLERTIATIKKTSSVKHVLEGIEMVYKNLRTILVREGLEVIESLGNPFNPNIHEILAQVPTDNCDDGIIIEEARKGYMFRGKVIRPSVVKLAVKSNKGEVNE